MRQIRSTGVRRRSLRPAHLAMGGALLFAPSGCEEVTVNVVEVAFLELAPDQVSLIQGEEETISAEARSSQGQVLSGRTVSWSTDDPEVAAVSSSGIVRAEAPGTTTIRATSEGVEGTASVIVLGRALIGLSRSDLEFHVVMGDDDPPEQEVELVNEGEGELSALSVSVEAEGPEGSDWLSAALDRSRAPTTLAVAVAAADLPPDRYEGTVFVSSRMARNSPRELRVILEVAEPPPEIDLDPVEVTLSSTAFSSESATESVRVENSGGGVLDELSTEIQYLGGPAGWLTAELESSTGPTVLRLRARARSLWRGTYRARVEVSSPAAPGGSRSVEVVFEVSLPWSEGQAPTGMR